MGEGALPGGVFRRAAPGEIEINIPGILESPVNRIIRKAYRGIHKGESMVRTKDNRLYPRGFTPMVDYISDPSNIDGVTGLPLESNERIKNYDLRTKKGIGTNPNKPNLTNKFQSFKEAPLNFFDAQTIQFRHLVEYYDNSESSGSSPMDVPTSGVDGRSPSTNFFGEYGDFNEGLYLASYLRTHRNNEDPTILGFDFHISLPNSPLFNGSVEEFITENSSNLDLNNRLNLLNEFKMHLLSFFKSWAPNNISENLPSVGQFFTFNNSQGSSKATSLTEGLFNGKGGNTRNTAKDYLDMYRGSSTKAYYIQSISGLDKLNEINEMGNGKKFVDWGKDFLTLTLNEDVSQNMGYLAALYKNLTWSRERGRLAIPENLLRFEAVLDITEVRNYVRIYKSQPVSSGSTRFSPYDTPKYREVADYTSKYRYFIHECQFVFDKMPHGDSISNSVQSESLKGLDLKIYFKHSNLRFMKFIPPKSADVSNDDYSDYINRYTKNSVTPDEPVFDVKLVDNTGIILPTDKRNTATGEKSFRELFELEGGAPFEEKNFLFQDGTDDGVNRRTLYNTAPLSHPLSEINLNDKLNVSVNPELSDTARRALINQKPLFGEKLLVGLADNFKDAKNQILNAGISFVNRNIVDAASLINRTLNQIYNSTPVVGGIRPPKNLYDAPNEFEQAYIDFIGPGLKTFFQDPMKFRKEGTPGETLETKIANNRLVSPLGLGSPFISKVTSVGNSADETGVNKKLKQLVDEDVDFGNGFSGLSTIPFLGNSADQVQGNKTTQRIVDEHPTFGKEFAGDLSSEFFSYDPQRGNTAQFSRGSKTLKQIVDNDPDLGFGPIISKIAFLGNKAQINFSNLTLDEKVEQDPKIGNGSKLLKGYFSSDPDTGNNASNGNNQSLLNIVLDNSIITTLGSFEWDDIQYPNSAQKLPEPSTTGITDIDKLIDANSKLKNAEIGNSGLPGKNNLLQNIITKNTSLDDPFLGNSGDEGPNQLNDVLVDSESDVEDSELGNSAQEGTNDINSIKVDKNSVVDDAFDGNSAINGPNYTNESIVDGNTILLIPELGNSADAGDSVLNTKVVELNTIVDDAELGNSALVGDNKTNDFVIFKNTDLVNPSLGNRAKRGETSTVDKIVSNSTDVEGPFIGNSANVEQSQSIEKIINVQSSLENPQEGNSANIGPIRRNDELVDSRSELVNPELGNSGLVSKTIQTDLIIEKNTSITNPSLGNSGQLSDNFSNQDKVDKLTKLVNPELGNSALVGNNLQKDNLVAFNSDVQDESIGNSATIGRNIANKYKVDDNSEVELGYLGNSAEVDKNVRGNTIVEKYSEVEDAEISNSAKVSENTTTDKLISTLSQLENPELGNSAELSLQNKTIDSKLLDDSVMRVDNSSSEKPNTPTESTIKENTILEQPYQGNSAVYSLPAERENLIELKSNVRDSEIGNSAPRGSRPRLDTLLVNFSKVVSEEIGNSAIRGLNISIKTKLQENLKDKDFGFISKIESGISTFDQTSNSIPNLPEPSPNFDDLKEYSKSSKLMGFYDWKNYKGPKWQ